MNEYKTNKHKQTNKHKIANPIDQDIIDQFTLGHQFLFKEFGVRPTSKQKET